MASTRRKPGHLGPQVEGHRAWLAHRGYTPQTVRNMLADLGQVGQHLLAVYELGEDKLFGHIKPQWTDRHYPGTS